MTLVLYSYFRSSCSWRVRIALNLKEIDYQIRPVNLLNNEQNSEEYKKISASPLVPSIVLPDGRSISQSIAILEYLEEAESKFPLLPKDLFKRAVVRSLVQIIASDIQPIQNLRVLKKVGEESKEEWARFWIRKGFEAFEEVLRKSAGTYCVGNDITLADVLLVPQVFNATRFGLELVDFPNINRIAQTLDKNEHFIRAHPKNQIDYPLKNE